MTRQPAPQVSPVMRRLSAYIAQALRKPLPAAVMREVLKDAGVKTVR